MKEKIIFQCGVTSETLSWNTPEVIETTMQQVATMAFPDKSLTGIVLEPSTKVMYESIDLNRTTKEISVNFNLTEIVPVLENRLVTLLNATMSLKSASTGNRQYDDWVLAGKGKQVILGMDSICRSHFPFLIFLSSDGDRQVVRSLNPCRASKQIYLLMQAWSNAACS